MASYAKTYSRSPKSLSWTTSFGRYQKRRKPCCPKKIRPAPPRWCDPARQSTVDADMLELPAEQAASNRKVVTFALSFTYVVFDTNY